MPRKSVQIKKIGENVAKEITVEHEENKEAEVEKLNRLLAAVLNYLSDDDVEEIDIEYLLKNTEGLREWWDEYREKNRKQIENEIKKSLSQLSLEQLESIREKIKDK